MRRIPLGYLNISEQGKQYVLDAIARNRLSRGEYTIRLEREFASLHDTRHGVFCNSGTSALHISLAALKERFGYDDGDEVIVPATTFIATSNIVLYNNLRPVFVDVDPQTYNIDPHLIRGHISSRTRVIIPVHLLGLPCDMNPIVDLSREYELRVLEDSAETMFARYHGRPVGSFGDLACFSTYVAHIIVGGIGGLITTNDAELAVICRSLMTHGRDHIYLDIDDDDRITDPMLKQIVQRRYNFVRLGHSFRATELEAAIALSELERSEYIIRRRQENAAQLAQLLDELQEFLQLPHIPSDVEHSFMMFPIVVRNGVEREDLLLHLERNGIETRYLFPLLNQPVYRRLFPGLADRYPVSKMLAQQGFFIGIHQGLEEEDLRYIADTFASYFQANL